VKQVAGLVAVLGLLVVADLALRRVLSPYQLQVVVLCGINVVLAVSLNLINGFTGQFSIGHAGFMALGAYGSAMFSLNLVGDALNAFVLGDQRTLIGLPISAAIIGYLLTPGVRRLFDDTGTSD